jgi:hypothetical protein
MQTEPQSTMALGFQSALQSAAPAAPRSEVFRYCFPYIPSTTSTGANRQLVADTGPVHAGSRDTVGIGSTGFKLTDFVSASFIADYDYCRVDKVEYTATLSNMPRSGDTNVLMYTSIDYDNATLNSFADLMKRPNKSLVVFNSANTCQKIVSFAPRRRISSNVDPSQQIVTKPGEWVDCAYAASLIYGNIKYGIMVPDGQQQFTVGDQCTILITATVWVSFKGRVNN